MRNDRRYVPGCCSSSPGMWYGTRREPSGASDWLSMRMNGGWLSTRDRLRAGADERQLVDVDVHRHEELAVGAFGAGDQEHRLQVEQLPVERESACGGRRTEWMLARSPSESR